MTVHDSAAQLARQAPPVSVRARRWPVWRYVEPRTDAHGWGSPARCVAESPSFSLDSRTESGAAGGGTGRRVVPEGRLGDELEGVRHAWPELASNRRFNSVAELE
jgi:hypothetical protein